MKQIFVLTFIISIGFIACSNGESQDTIQTSDNSEEAIQASESGTAIISGELQNAANSILVLEKLSAQGSEFVDSIKVDEKGKFKTTVNMDYPTFFRLKASNNSFTNLALNIGDKLVVTGDANNLNNTYAIKGSEEAKLYKEFGDKMAYFYQRRDSLNKAMQQHQTNGDGQAMTQAQQYFMQLQQEFMSFNHSFIDKNPGAMASLAAVSGLQPETDIEYYKKVHDAMIEKMPNSPYLQQLKQVVDKASVLAIGSAAPEIVSTKPDGSTQKLSDLKGKVVLIDFWASWCGPCRRESPNVVEAYKKYKDKGFTVFSVSLDGMAKQKNPRQEWLNAIKQDGLLWDNHVSDLKGWNSAVVPAYQIQGIPLTVLVDRKGKIIAKNLRGPTLDQKLNEVLGG